MGSRVVVGKLEEWPQHIFPLIKRQSLFQRQQKPGTKNPSSIVRRDQRKEG
ncbi:hypothetical protein AKJ16_DCAP13143, partial [Drosera capensis]